MKKQALEIINTLKNNGYQAFYAGGAVRDMVLGMTPTDYDVATDAKPEIVETLFEETLSVGRAFGVIVVIIDGIQTEVATFRQDSKESSDGRHPDSVTFSSMEEDAKRRDLTINGMFYDPIKEELIDCVKGHEDIHDKIIRLIGDPEARIAEDKLRMLRVVRFSAKLGFSVDSATMRTVKTHSSEILQVSAERITEELQKILRTGKYRQGFDLLFETGLIDHILPEVRAMKGCEQPPEFHSEGDVYVHTLLALENLPDNASDELRMATLLHDVGKPATQTFEDRIRFSGHDLRGKDMAREIMARMRVSKDFSDRVLALVGNHMKFMAVKEMRTSRLKRFMSLPFFDEHMALHKADCLSSHRNLENYDFVAEKLKTYEPEEIRPVKVITGKDLLKMGFKAGPLFKQILTDVEDRQLEGLVSDREQALKYVAETYECFEGPPGLNHSGVATLCRISPTELPL
jgi:poly(A) polymerase